VGGKAFADADARMDKAFSGHISAALYASSACRTYVVMINNLRGMGCGK
jgi:hypothetical protein